MITPSTLLRKYVGETNILVRTLWKLAEKLSPCIILLDELDGLFRERRGDEHDVSRESKTEFLQWWDGISKHNQAILVVGATNRPFDVDSAVLRRMPQSHFCGLPMAPARLETFQSLLQKIPHESMDLRGIVDSTQGYSPSDLVQIVQTAVQSGPLREARFQQHSRGYRALTALDLVNARQVVGPTPLSEDYRRALVEYTQRHNSQHVSQAQPPQHSQGGMQDGGEWGSFYHAGTFQADIEGTAIEEQASVESEWSEYDSQDEAENGSDADS
jgi:SpoVK/Ycf46/Vps4 family AAA+-type ATPase